MNNHIREFGNILTYNEDVYGDSDQSDHSDYDMYSDASDSYSAHSKRDDKSLLVESDSNGEDCQSDDLIIPSEIECENDQEPLRGKYNGSVVLKFTKSDSFIISLQALEQLKSAPLTSLTIIRPEIEMKEAGFLNDLMTNFFDKFDFTDLQSFTLNMPLGLNPQQTYQPISQYQTVRIRRKFLSRLLKKLTNQCTHLTKLKLKLDSWYSGEDQMSDSNLHSMIQLISNIVQNNENLNYLSLNCFQWGYYNKTANNTVVQTLCSAIQKRNLQHLNLDIGRWGCENYVNHRIFTSIHTKLIAETLRSQRNLEYLSLNFRSWGYNNPDISDIQVIELIDAISSLPLRKIHLEISKWKFSNAAITNRSIEKLALCISQMKTLKKIFLDLSGWGKQNEQELKAYEMLFVAPTFLTHLLKRPMIRVDQSIILPLKNQIALIDEVLKQITQENKGRLYAAKQMRNYYGSLLRNEIIGDMIEQCNSFNVSTIKPKMVEIMKNIGIDQDQNEGNPNHGQNMLLAALIDRFA